MGFGLTAPTLNTLTAVFHPTAVDRSVLALNALLGLGTALGVLGFGLAGLGCSALLPLTISFGQEELAVMSASVAGGVIAFYQLGSASPRSAPVPCRTPASAFRSSSGSPRWRPWSWAACPLF